MSAPIAEPEPVVTSSSLVDSSSTGSVDDVNAAMVPSEHIDAENDVNAALVPSEHIVHPESKAALSSPAPTVSRKLPSSGSNHRVLRLTTKARAVR